MTKHPSEHHVGQHVDTPVEKDIRAVLIVLVVTSIIQLLSISVYMYNAAQDREESMVQRSLDRQFSMLERQFERQDTKYKEIEYPLIELRASLETISKLCSKGLTALTLDDRNQLANAISQKSKYITALVQANGASQVIFGEALHNNIRNLVLMVEKNGDGVCPAGKMVITRSEQVNSADNLMFEVMDETYNKMLALAKAMKEI